MKDDCDDGNNFDGAVDGCNADCTVCRPILACSPNVLTISRKVLEKRWKIGKAGKIGKYKLLNNLNLPSCENSKNKSTKFTISRSFHVFLDNYVKFCIDEFKHLIIYLIT